MSTTPAAVAPRNETVFVVDDDEAMRDSLTWLLEGNGYTVRTYRSAEEFLVDDKRGEGVGCLILDVRMQGMSGPELQDRLLAENSRMPIVFVTGHGDVPMAVSTMKKGAVDFIENRSTNPNCASWLNACSARPAAKTRSPASKKRPRTFSAA